MMTASRWTGGDPIRNPGEVRVRRLPTNRVGRDFVLGDPHGCPERVRHALGVVGYDRETGDRLFIVGDLFDRGPDSVGMADLVDELGAYVTLGNHEVMLLDALGPLITVGGTRPKAMDLLIANGGRWVLDELIKLDVATTPTKPSDRLADILANVAGLPHIYVVGEGAQRYNIVHAEIPVGTDIEVDAGLPEPRRYRPVEDLTCWARNIMGVGEDNWGDWPLLSPTYCGHTIGRTVRRRYSHVCLDLGTYATGRVALAEPSAGTVHIIEPDDE